ncbi:hypothetical protein KIPB_013549, partial [Kipferlia bialata]
ADLLPQSTPMGHAVTPDSPQAEAGERPDFAGKVNTDNAMMFLSSIEEVTNGMIFRLSQLMAADQVDEEDIEQLVACLPMVAQSLTPSAQMLLRATRPPSKDSGPNSSAATPTQFGRRDTRDAYGGSLGSAKSER